jgi:3-hydroxyisobutyrate dehydrogenase
MQRGAGLIDFTTSSPDLARRIWTAASTRGVRALDAPVSGGDVGARHATLSIMAGGDAADFEQVRPVLDILGQTVVLQGPAGSGQHTKMVNQILVASGMIGICEAILYARRAGLEPDTVLQSVGGGAASSWALTNLAPRILKGDLEPGFFVEHFVKDMDIALEECRRMNLSLPGLELAHRLYQQVVAMGLGRKGTQVLYHALEQGPPPSP